MKNLRFFLLEMNEKGLFYDFVCPIWQAVILQRLPQGVLHGGCEDPHEASVVVAGNLVVHVVVPVVRVTVALKYGCKLAKQ